MLHRVQGIVLRSMDYGEGNKIISLFTTELGKVSVMARGAKKMKSRYSAVTQLFTYGDYVFYKPGQMGTLNHAEIIDSHHSLREDLHGSAYASYIVEMLDRMMGDQDKSPFLFEQLKASLTAMEEKKDMQIIVHLFEMKMLALAGYLPVLDQCVSCGGVTSDLALSCLLGGLLCTRCRFKDSNRILLSEGTLKLLRLFQHMDIRRLGTIEVKESTKLQLKQCMRAYMDTHIGIQWKARNFLDQMEKYNM